MALAQNMIPSVRLEDYDRIECVDVTTSLLMDSLHPLAEPALNFGGSEVYRDLRLMD